MDPRIKVTLTGSSSCYFFGPVQAASFGFRTEVSFTPGKMVVFIAFTDQAFHRDFQNFALEIVGTFDYAGEEYCQKSWAFSYQRYLLVV